MGKFRLPHLLLLGIVALAAEMTILPAIRFGDFSLEPLLLLCCFSALFARDARQAAWGGWMLGLIKDLGSAGPAGLYAFLFLFTATTIHRLRPLLFREHPATQIGVVFVSTSLVLLADGFASFLLQQPFPFSRLLSRSLCTALFSALSMPVLVSFLRMNSWLLR